MYKRYSTVEVRTIYIADFDIFYPDAFKNREKYREICEDYGVRSWSCLLDAKERLERSGVKNCTKEKIFEESLRELRLLGKWAGWQSNCVVVVNLDATQGSCVEDGIAFIIGYAYAYKIPVFGYTNSINVNTKSPKDSTTEGSNSPLGIMPAHAIQIIRGDFGDCLAEIQDYSNDTLSLFFEDSGPDWNHLYLCHNGQYPWHKETPDDIGDRYDKESRGRRHSLFPTLSYDPIWKPKKFYFASPNTYSDHAKKIISWRFMELCASYGHNSFCSQYFTNNDETPKEIFRRFLRNRDHLYSADCVIADLNRFHGSRIYDSVAFDIGFAVAFGIWIFGYFEDDDAMVDVDSSTLSDEDLMEPTCVTLAKAVYDSEVRIIHGDFESCLKEAIKNQNKIWRMK